MTTQSIGYFIMNKLLNINFKIYIAWIAASLSLLAMTPSHASDKLTVTYGIYTSGFNVVDIKGTYDISDTSYDLTMDMNTVGLLGTLAPWSGVIHSDGVFNKSGQATSQNYKFSATWRGETETSTMSFDKTGLLSSYRLEKSDGRVIDKMPANNVYDDLPNDILTSLLNVMMRPETCALIQKTFDGKRRFDMVFTSHGTEQRKPNNYSVYDGNTEICDIEILPVSGKWRDKPRGWMSVQQQAKKQGELPRLWFGKIRDDMPPIPVRFMIKTDYGTMIMHLKDIQE